MTKQEVFKNCTIEGSVVKLPDVQFERKFYQDIAKSLELIGGKWKSNLKGFLFPSDPTDLLKQIADGEQRNLKKEFQFFATPKEIADRLVYLSNIKENDTVLEPSAGQGAIIQAINSAWSGVPDCYELMDINREILLKSKLKFNLLGDDFLQHHSKSYTKIIANPPFAKNQDIDHLLKMYSFLEENGRLVCITSESWVNGSQKKQMDFKNWLDDVNAEIIDIKSGAFKDSGTMVGARIVIINK